MNWPQNFKNFGQKLANQVQTVTEGRCLLFACVQIDVFGWFCVIPLPIVRIIFC